MFSVLNVAVEHLEIGRCNRSDEGRGIPGFTVLNGAAELSKKKIGRCNRSNEGRTTLDVPGAKCCLGTFGKREV